MNRKLPFYASIISMLLSIAVLASCGKNATMMMAQEDLETPDDMKSYCTGMYGPYVGWDDFQRRSNDECSPLNTENEYVGLFGIFDEAMRNPYYESTREKVSKGISSDFDKELKELLVLGEMKDFSEKDPKSVTSGDCQELLRKSLVVFRGKEYAEGITTCYEQVADLNSTKIELGEALNNETRSLNQCNKEKNELSKNVTRQHQESESLASDVAQLNVDKAKLERKLNDTTHDLNQCQEEKSALTKNITDQLATSRRTNEILRETRLMLDGCRERREVPQIPPHPALVLLWGYPAANVAMAGVGTSGVLLGVLGWKSWAYSKEIKNLKSELQKEKRARLKAEGAAEASASVASIMSRDSKSTKRGGRFGSGVEIRELWTAILLQAIKFEARNRYQDLNFYRKYVGHDYWWGRDVFPKSKVVKN